MSREGVISRLLAEPDNKQQAALACSLSLSLSTPLPLWTKALTRGSPPPGNNRSSVMPRSGRLCWGGVLWALEGSRSYSTPFSTLRRHTTVQICAASSQDNLTLHRCYFLEPSFRSCREVSTVSPCTPSMSMCSPGLRPARRRGPKGGAPVRRTGWSLGV